MIILPAIDIKDGNCVRLIKGEFGTAQKVAESPFETAKRFKEAGAKWMHMVDLDGAKTGDRPNRNIILRVIQQSGLNVEIGGGIRDMDCVRDYLEGGAARVILGSAALENKNFIKKAVTDYGEKIAVGIDSRDGKVATRGWLDTSDVLFTEFAKDIEQIGVKCIIFTDISCDGTLEGPNFEQLQELQEAVSCNIIASGGIRDIGNIRRLCKMNLYGAICGKSIYSGTLDLKQAIKMGDKVQ